MAESKKRGGLFAEKAMEKLASPEQIDKLLIVMTPKGWLALITCFLLIAVTLIWSFLGTIPISVSGKGILLTPKGVFSIVSPTEGIVDEMRVKSGQRVPSHAVIAKVAGQEVVTLSEAVILEVFASKGNFAQSGTPLAWALHPKEEGEPYLCWAFFDVASGEKIKQGMEARIALEDVDLATMGYLLGKVEQVSPFPVSERAMKDLLYNPELVELLKGENKAVIRVLISLTQDPHSPSGYRFTTKKGAPGSLVVAGAIADVRIITAHRTPISYLFPAFAPRKEG